MRFRLKTDGVLPLGRLCDQLRFSFYAPDGQLVTRSVQISGRVVTDLAADPEVLFFGLLERGSTTTRDFKIFSRTNKRFSIGEIVVSSEKLAVALPSGRSGFFVEVQVSADEVGDIDEWVTVYVDGESSLPRGVRVRAKGRVLPVSRSR